MYKKLFIVVLTLIVSSCSITKNMGNAQVKGNGNFVSEMRELSKFKAIEIAIGYDKIIVNCGGEPSLLISGDENIKDNIKIKHFLFIIIKPFLNPKYTAINQHNFPLELGNEASGSQFFRLSTHNFAEI